MSFGTNTTHGRMPSLRNMIVLSAAAHLAVIVLFQVMPPFRAGRDLSAKIIPVELVTIQEIAEPASPPKDATKDASPPKKIVEPAPEPKPVVEPPKKKPGVSLVEKKPAVEKPAPKKKKKKQRKKAPSPKPKIRPEKKEPPDPMAAALERVRKRQKAKEYLDKRKGKSHSGRPSSTSTFKVGSSESFGNRYLERLSKLLNDAWILPEQAPPDRPTTICIRFDTEGRFRDCRIEESSGSATFDYSAQRAVLKLGKLPSPPPEFSHGGIDTICPKFHPR